VIKTISDTFTFFAELAFALKLTVSSPLLGGHCDTELTELCMTLKLN
jgi:hypothetical protein